MNMFLFFLFLMKIFIFYRLDIFEKSLISFQLQAYLSIVLNCLITRRLMVKLPIFYYISIIIVHFHVSQCLIINYYDDGISYYSETDLIILYGVITAIFSNIGKEEFVEIERDHVFNYIYLSIRNLIEVYRYCYFFFAYQSDKIKESFIYSNLFFKILIDLLIINSNEIICYFKSYFSSKTKKNFFFGRIFRRVFLLILITLAYYLLNYTSFTKLVYSCVCYIFPIPHCLVLYNAFPIEIDARFKFSIFILIEIIL